MPADPDHYLRVPITRGELRIVLGGEDPDTIENTDGFIDLDDGTTRTFTALTLAEVDRVMKKWEQSGESSSGAYLRVPDLIILRAGGAASIVAAVDDLAHELPIIALEEDDQQ
jgi:ABC-type Fe2+-enterobactin transport system substrate-binding protein